MSSSNLNPPALECKPLAASTPILAFDDLLLVGPISLDDRGRRQRGLLDLNELEGGSSREGDDSFYVPLLAAQERSGENDRTSGSSVPSSAEHNGPGGDAAPFCLTFPLEAVAPRLRSMIHAGCGRRCLGLLVFPRWMRPIDGPDLLPPSAWKSEGIHG